MLRPATDPFQADGGMRLVEGNLGRAIFKTSAVDAGRWTIEAPARCFSDQNEVLEAFKAGELDRDVAVVVRFQGPRANGMPELHKLTPALGVVQDRGLSRRAGHRRPHVGRQRQGAGSDPRLARSASRRPAGARARRRHDPAVRRDGTLEAVGVDLAARDPRRHLAAAAASAPAASCSR